MHNHENMDTFFNVLRSIKEMPTDMFNYFIVFVTTPVSRICRKIDSFTFSVILRNTYPSRMKHDMHEINGLYYLYIYKCNSICLLISI